MKTLRTSIRAPAAQRGALTLLMATTLMVILGLGALFIAKVGLSEQRLSYNFVQSKKLDSATNTALFDAANDVARKPLETAAVAGVLTSFPLRVNNKTNFDVLDSAGGVLARYSALLDNTALTTPDLGRLLLTVTTVLNDGAPMGRSSTRVVTQLLDYYPTLRATPTAAVITAGALSVGNGANIVNTNATFGTLATWSGGALSTSGMPTISTVSVQNDANLNALTTATFYKNFFSDDPGFDQQKSWPVDCTAGTGCKSKSAAVNSINFQVQSGQGMYGLVWVSGDLTLDGKITLGSADFPLILVVEGNLTLSHAQAVLYGVAYVRAPGTFTMTKGTIYGTVISESTATVNGGSIFYEDATAMGTNGQQAVANTASIGYYVKIPGTWQDI